MPFVLDGLFEGLLVSLPKLGHYGQSGRQIFLGAGDSAQNFRS